MADEGRPGFVAMAAGLAGAAIDHFADAARKASPAAVAAREAACLACVPYHDPGPDACLACGCGTIRAVAAAGIDLKLKRSWASSRCPLAEPRWGPELG